MVSGLWVGQGMEASWGGAGGLLGSLPAEKVRGPVKGSVSTVRAGGLGSGLQDQQGGGMDGSGPLPLCPGHSEDLLGPAGQDH